MRIRVQNRIRKAIRIAAHAHPELARRCRGRSLPAALIAISADRQAPAELRGVAAELLAFARHPDPWRPLIDHLLDCDGTSAWSLSQALPYRGLRLTAADEAGFARILRKDPDEERRAATAQFLQAVHGPAVTRVLIEALEDRAESSYVRGRAAEALNIRGSLEAVDACIRCLKDPDPGARFWAVFAVGGLTQCRPALHPIAMAALEPLIGDTAQVPGYWSVGREAMAMLEHMIPGRRELNEHEREAALDNPNAPPDLKNWAECYSHRPAQNTVHYTQARYRNLTWRRFPSGE